MITGQVRARLDALVAQYLGGNRTALARAAGERQQDVDRFFQGRMKYPPLDFLDNLARVCQRTVADVLRDDLPKTSLTETQIEILARLKALKPHERAAFEALLGLGRRAGRRRGLR